MKEKLKNLPRAEVRNIVFWMIMGQSTNPQTFTSSWGYLLKLEDDLLVEALLTEFPDGPKQAIINLYRCKVEEMEFRFRVAQIRDFIKYKDGILHNIMVDEIHLANVINEVIKKLDI